MHAHGKHSSISCEANFFHLGEMCHRGLQLQAALVGPVVTAELRRASKRHENKPIDQPACKDVLNTTYQCEGASPLQTSPTASHTGNQHSQSPYEGVNHASMLICGPLHSKCNRERQELIVKRFDRQVKHASSKQLPPEVLIRPHASQQSISKQSPGPKGIMPPRAIFYFRAVPSPTPKGERTTADSPWVHKTFERH
jgi:hypothetical protein